MRDALILAFLLTSLLVLGVIAATWRVFDGVHVTILRHYGVQCAGYAGALCGCLSLALSLVVDRNRSLRITGTKMKHVEAEMKERGWIAS